MPEHGYCGIMDSSKQIVVLGAGFAGLACCRQLAKTHGAHVTLVECRNHHLFQPLLYQAATGDLSMTEIAQPVRELFASEHHPEVQMRTAEGIDLEKRKVEFADGTLDYDYLVCALGAQTTFFGNDEWQEHVFKLKSLRDALRLREHVLSNFEEADRTADTAEKERLLTIGIVGAGPTGVEMAGALAELGHSVLAKDYPGIAPSHVRVVLIEALPQVLPQFEDPLPASAREFLEEMGVEVWTDSAVEDVQSGRIVCGDSHLDCGTILWVPGNEGHPLFRDMGVELDKRKRVKVQPDGSLFDHPEVFVVGDTACWEDANGKEVPGLAPAAMQEGKYVAKLIESELETGPQPGKRKPFRYRDRGNLCTVGRNRAVAEIYGLKLAGFSAWVLWLGLHLFFLIGFRNRLFTMINWGCSYLAYRPGARIAPAIWRTPS